MVVVYVPIDPDNKSLIEQQKKFIDEMLKKGWKHLGHTKLKDFLGVEITVAILFSDTLWKEEIEG